MLTNISGFPEYLPEYQITFNRIIDIVKSKFELYGFCPLETPAVERVSTLLAKGNDNEIYGIYRLADPNDKKDLALRFDLTVPLARYVAQHSEKLVFPYKRYHIAPVWRGERPQAGRYRQFYQCDIDIVDTSDLPITSDAEVLAVVYDILQELGVDFEIRINNRKLLNEIISKITGDNCNVAEILRVIDKKEKITHDAFCEQLCGAGLSNIMVDELNAVFNAGSDILDNSMGSQGNDELKALYANMQMFGISSKNIAIDLTLARGFTYYTGNVFEVKLRNLNFSGSIAGGGRYDNLASLFSNKKKYPGVGVTLGISRLVPVLIENGLFDISAKTPASVLVTVQDPECIGQYIEVARKLRNIGIKTEVFLQHKKLAHQMTYANKKGFKFVVIADCDELDSGKFNIKNMVTGSQKTISISDLEHELYGVINE